MGAAGDSHRSTVTNLKICTDRCHRSRCSDTWEWGAAGQRVCEGCRETALRGAHRHRDLLTGRGTRARLKLRGQAASSGGVANPSLEAHSEFWLFRPSPDLTRPTTPAGTILFSLGQLAADVNRIHKTPSHLTWVSVSCIIGHRRVAKWTQSQPSHLLRNTENACLEHGGLYRRGHRLNALRDQEMTHIRGHGTGRHAPPHGAGLRPPADVCRNQGPGLVNLPVFKKR